ncbi:MAG: hypothetical protein KC729_16250 [Candidatus Eisenbacteria bacterium]|uniref:Uncharacterized protein n=1 Tax=Eiseniibacteriota bacterium TaxID=2212470 RepID=A0A956M0V1_UNCEI|nr:hypothetical protein [Candidatus Eisenbacteria bacterium]
MLRRYTGLLVLASTLMLVSCKDNATNVPDPGETRPDFTALDVNPNSATHGEMVSPSDYIGSISAYYFGHAT